MVPVNPHQAWLGHYVEAVRSRLTLNSFSYLQMVMTPAFVGESAVRLHPESGDREMEKVDKVFLTYAVASENIYYATQTPKPGKKPEDVSVTVTTIEFPKPLALRLYKLWSKMLLRTRYPQEPLSMVTDGTSIEFGCEKLGWGSVYGEAYFPTRAKSPMLFSDAGLALMDYGKAAPAERAQAAKKIEAAADRLEAYLKKHPAK
ncbi:MAG TPA: hypothetical protein VNW92_24445 [Polyangiaceae bacterium]|nr:hypothetical protein [Polyangiaceae bacterium]